MEARLRAALRVVRDHALRQDREAAAAVDVAQVDGALGLERLAGLTRLLPRAVDADGEEGEDVLRRGGRDAEQLVQEDLHPAVLLLRAIEASVDQLLRLRLRLSGQWSVVRAQG